MGKNLSINLRTKGNFDFSDIYDWDDFFTSCSHDEYPLLWQSNIEFGIRIKEEFNILVRFGAGNSHSSNVNPFFALDIGQIRF